MSLLGEFIIINKQKEEIPRRTAVFTLSPHSLHVQVCEGKKGQKPNWQFEDWIQKTDTDKRIDHFSSRYTC